MLRLLTVLLVAANLLYFGWTLGWLDAVVGIPATGDREPDRVARQVRPELVLLEHAASVVVPPQPASGASEVAAGALAAASTAAASTPPASAPATSLAKAAPAAAASAASNASLCLEAGPFAASDLPAAEKMLQSAWADGQWTRRRIEGSANWLIFMGPYPDDSWLERKKGELARIRGGLPYEVLTAPPQLARGISLGRFGSQAAAEQRLNELRLRGIRTAKIVNAGNGPDTTMLRVAEADNAVAARLAALKWPSGMAGVTPCPKPP